MARAEGSNRWTAEQSMRLVILLLQTRSPDLSIGGWKTIESPLSSLFKGKVSINAAQQHWLKLKKAYLKDGGEALKNLLAGAAPPSSGGGGGGDGEGSKAANDLEPDDASFDSDNDDEDEDDEGDGGPADKSSRSRKGKQPARKDQPGDGDAFDDA